MVIRYICFTVCLILALPASANSTKASVATPQIEANTVFDKRELTLTTQLALTDQNLLNKTIGELTKNPKGISIEELAKKLSSEAKFNAGLQRLKTASINSCVSDKTTLSEISRCTTSRHAGIVEVPELWLFTPENYNVEGRYQDLLFAYAPKGEESRWTRIEAFDRFGNTVYLDPNIEPQVPVIVVETRGSQAFEVKVALMNEALRTAGLQKQLNKKQGIGLAQANSGKAIDTSKMTKIRLNDDKEPWIKGSAEIYMITSGVKNDRNEAELRITPLNYLDEEDKNYFPNQLVLFWDDYSYDAANIQFWEDDGDTNYQSLVLGLIDAIGRAGGLFGVPELTAIMEIASIIVEAMPEEWYSDDDDFVDTCYTIERNATYSNHYCAAANARISLEPFVLTGGK